MSLSPEEKIKDCRARVLAGEEIPQEELKDALRLYREQREGAVKAAVEKKEKREAAKASIPENLGDLFATPAEKPSES
jgi:hypothetical protein